MPSLGSCACPSPQLQSFAVGVAEACSWTLTAARLLPRFPHRVTKCHVPQVYSPLDWSQGLLFLMAVGTVVAGSLWAATDEAAARGRQRKDGSSSCEAGAEAADGSEPLVAATARQVGNLVESWLEGAEPCNTWAGDRTLVGSTAGIHLVTLLLCWPTDLFSTGSGVSQGFPSQGIAHCSAGTSQG